MRGFALLLAALLFAGCTLDAVFVIDVAAPDGLAGREVDIRRLRVTLENDDITEVLLFPEEGPAAAVPLPTDFSFSVPKERRGVVEVTVEALDAQEIVIGLGQSAGTIGLGQRNRFTVELDPIE
jgi:hypothetical protein